MSTLKQRKFLTAKKNNFYKNTPCGCGGTVLEKNHGTWTGWFCPKCKSGGSRNNTRYR